VFDVHDAVVPLAYAISSRHVPAALAAAVAVAGWKCPVNVSVILTLLLLSTPFWDVLVLNDPFGWIATCRTPTDVLVLPEGVQDSAVVGRERFSTLLPPGAT
jgi:hypothetical protein